MDKAAFTICHKQFAQPALEFIDPLNRAHSLLYPPPNPHLLMVAHLEFDRIVKRSDLYFAWKVSRTRPFPQILGLQVNSGPAWSKPRVEPQLERVPPLVTDTGAFLWNRGPGVCLGRIEKNAPRAQVIFGLLR